MTYLNHAHTSGPGRSSATVTTGETYIPRPASTGLCGAITCSRCGVLATYSQTEHDKHPLFNGKSQRRCIDRAACSGKRAA